jgi:hypothetical protein
MTRTEQVPGGRFFNGLQAQRIEWRLQRIVKLQGDYAIFFGRPFSAHFLQGAG